MNQPILMCQGFMTDEKGRGLWIQMLQKATEPDFSGVNQLNFYEFDIGDLLVKEATRCHNAKAVAQIADELRGVAAILDMVARGKDPAP